MGSVYFLILCSFLQAGNESTATIPPGRLPAVQQAPFTPAAPVQTIPTAVQPAAPPSTEPKQLFFRNGLLDLPKRNRVPLAATERAVLMSLRTEQRDAAGNVIRDNEGNPIMIPITEGMNVFKGQVLGNFDDRELRCILKINQAELEVAKAEQDKDIEKDYAARSLQVAIANHLMLKEANKRHSGTYAAIEVRRAELEEDQARANLELQKYNIDEIKTREVTVRESKLEQTEVQIELRKLIAPLDGMIIKIGAAEGEWLREGDTVLEIVQLDTLWVQVKINAKEYSISDFDGKQAILHVTLANGRTETFQGAVVFCNPVVEAGNTFVVYIEVQNRRIGNFWLLQPGLDGVDIVIPL